MKKTLAALLTGAAALSTGFHPASASAAAWKFGVISDTQWIVTNDGKSPASVPAGIIKQIDQAFIANGVKLVIAVGDTEDMSSASNDYAIRARQLYAQDLYNAGIAFYPHRGNHESGGTASATNFALLYPQITNGGINNSAVSNSVSAVIAGWSDNATYGTKAGVSNTLLSILPPDSRTNTNTFTVGSNFSYPSNNGPGPLQGSTANGGLSYSFDYNNVRFVLLDPYTTSTTPASNTVANITTNWLSGRLSDGSRPLQAFVFGHANVLGGNHKDNLFGAQPTGDPGDGSTTNTVVATQRKAAVDSFVSTLYSNNVHYYIGGHDHHHKHSIVRSPLNSTNFIEQIISQSDSDKFYTPAAPFSTNETSIDEDLYEIGLYIYTVDGPRVTVDYCAVPANLPNPVSVDNFTVTPVLTGNWAKLLTLGYSLNGKTFSVPQGTSYTFVSDNTTNAVTNSAVYGETGFVGTTLSILSGTNGSTLTTRDGRSLTKIINTGWAPKATNTISDIASIWGLGNFSASQIDTITVAVSFPTNGISDPNSVVLTARDPKSGLWIKAVDYNLVGGTNTVTNGAYTSAPTTLGSYGVDLTNGIAYATINGPVQDFAVVSTNALPTYLPWDLNHDGVVTTADAVLLNTAIRTHSTNSVYDLNNDGKVDSADARWLVLHYSHAGGN